MTLVLSLSRMSLDLLVSSLYKVTHFWTARAKKGTPVTSKRFAKPPAPSAIIGRSGTNRTAFCRDIASTFHGQRGGSA